MSVLAACLTPAARADSFLTRPDINGNQVVFTAEGDLWIYRLDTNEARRLTSDPGIETNAHFSPDGTEVAFTANYEGGQDVYVMPVSGGIPKRLTYDGASIALGWTPNGSKVLYRTPLKAYAPFFDSLVTQELFTVPATGGLPVKIAVPRGSFASFNADGKTLAYVPISNEWMNWFRYEAGEADSIWLADLQAHTFEQLTKTKGVDTQPVWVGSTIYFVSERSGVRNLWSLDPSSKAVRQITFSTSNPVRYPSSDGHRIVFELGPKLETYDPATNSTDLLSIHLGSDMIHARPFRAQIGANAKAADINPTGSRVAIVARGQLVTAPTEKGVVDTIVDNSGQRVVGAAWSPDGNSIAYVSDASGEEQLWLADAKGFKEPKQISHDLKGEHSAPVWAPNGKYVLIGDRESRIQLVDVATGNVKTIAHSKFANSYDNLTTDFVFSPDSKWVAYSEPEVRDIDAVWLYEISSGKAIQLTDPAIDSISPAFSADGLYLYFLQLRDLSVQVEPISAMLSHKYQEKLSAVTLASSTPSPYAAKMDDDAEPAHHEEAPKTKEIKVDLDQIGERIIDMNAPPNLYTNVIPEANRILLIGPEGLEAYDIKAKSITLLSPGVTSATLSANAKKLLIVGPAGPQVLDAGTGPFGPAQGRLDVVGQTIKVDPVAEWGQIFRESWRVARDFFYDPNMHGVNWNAMRTKYEAQLPLVGDRADLTRLVASMLSELNTGHCYVFGPSPFAQRGALVASLGADLDFDVAAGAYRIKHIIRGGAWSPDQRSPLLEPGLNIHEGDYLLRIGRDTLQRDQDPAASLLGAAGHTITITVNSKPSADGARTIPIVPLGSDAALRLDDWIRGRAEYVDKASSGQIGYVYVPDMTPFGANEFAKGYYGNVDKPGIIIDVRGNGGGNISSNLLARINSKPTGSFVFRSGGTFRREGWAPLGKVVAVANEYSFSDGESFSEGFKRLKIGPLVGRRTGGGQVGSGGGYALMDGGAIYIPNYGFWYGNEWLIEGRGAVPDYDVQQDPAAVMAGKDPQLDKAIQLILDDLKEHPFSSPEHPPFPVKLGGSRSGAK